MERVKGEINFLKKVGNREEIHLTSRSNFKTGYYWVFNVIIMIFGTLQIRN